jgi:phytoene dehydrogenase-like protein
MDDTAVAVAGGGLAGLVAARRLADAGADVTVFERHDTVGGRVRTRRVDGYVLDRGFQVLFPAYPAVRRELDIDALDLQRFAPGAVLARPGERSTLADPLRDPRALPDTLRNPEVTTTDKLRTLALRQHVRTRDERETFAAPDATIREYLRDWGFSERYVDNFVAPFYGGITLDRSLSTSKRVFEYTFKMLSEGPTALPAEGMGAVPAQLAERARDAGATIRTGEPVEAVDGGSGTVETGDRRHEVDAVVVATDPPTARELTGVSSIPTEARPSTTLYLSLPASTGFDPGRRIHLNVPDDRPNAVVPLSAVAPTYAPDDEALLCATFLGERALDADESTLFDAVRDALTAWYPDVPFEGLAPVTTDRIEFAQFAQPPGVHDALPDARAPAGDVYLAGDFTAWSSIQGALRSGREAAEAVVEDA